MRRGWKKGDWLVVDEESGLTVYAKEDEIVTDYYGTLKRKKYAHKPNPQDFIRALDDPKTVPVASPDNVDFEVKSYYSYYVGETTVPTGDGVANHLYVEPYGIGEAIIGETFYVWET